MTTEECFQALEEGAVDAVVQGIACRDGRL